MIKLDLVARAQANYVMEHEFDDLDSIAFELVALRRVSIAALNCVNNPSWAGICDEDVLLENALRDAGLL